MREEHDGLIYKVIRNYEGQFSLWMVERENPPGWIDTGDTRGSKVECLTYIRNEFWREREIVSHANSPASQENRLARAVSGAQ